MLQQHQIDQFTAAGYTVVPGLLDGDQVAQLFERRPHR